MAEQVTKMAIKVDLQCRRCYKKIKKILCEIPQVKDQSFDEKQNAVTITVVGGCPENVRQKILRKGRCFVQGVDILPEKKKDAKPDQDDKKKKKQTEDASGSKGGNGKTSKNGKPDPAPQVPTYPPVYVMGWACVCPPCLSRGCDGFCPCNCHCGWPPMCDDGCRRPPVCHDGCGRPAHECECRRPCYLGCSNRCNEGKACSSRTPCGCGCGCGCGRGWPPVCSDAGYPQCQKSCLQM